LYCRKCLRLANVGRWYEVIDGSLDWVDGERYQDILAPLKEDGPIPYLRLEFRPIFVNTLMEWKERITRTTKINRRDNAS